LSNCCPYFIITVFPRLKVFDNSNRAPFGVICIVFVPDIRPGWPITVAIFDSWSVMTMVTFDCLPISSLSTSLLWLPFDYCLPEICPVAMHLPFEWSWFRRFVGSQHRPRWRHVPIHFSDDFSCIRSPRQLMVSSSRDSPQRSSRRMRWFPGRTRFEWRKVRPWKTGSASDFIRSKHRTNASWPQVARLRQVLGRKATGIAVGWPALSWVSFRNESKPLGKTRVKISQENFKARLGNWVKYLGCQTYWSAPAISESRCFEAANQISFSDHAKRNNHFIPEATEPMLRALQREPIEARPSCQSFDFSVWGKVYRHSIHLHFVAAFELKSTDKMVVLTNKWLPRR
jgi:hypothetical protein